ncbi:MAG: CRTAC1 family protein [Verrucomicrobiia bacterium]
MKGPLQSGKVRRNWSSARYVLPCLFLGLLVGGCSRQPQPSRSAGSERSAVGQAEPWFEEVSRQAGVRFEMTTGHRAGQYLFPEIKGGGLGVLDYNSDGLLDIFCVQTGSLHADETNRLGHKLYRNLGNWRFEDVTEAAGVGGRGIYCMGCACGDFNGDSHVDIYVTGLGTNTLFRNNGNGTFADVTAEAGVANGGWSMSSVFLDYDGDGRQDLAVANYVKWSPAIEMQCFSQGGLPDYCSPLNYKAPSMITLFHNVDNQRFEDVTLAAGLDKAFGYGLGIVSSDFNRDGRTDIFVANDATPNQLWINEGNGTFTDEGMRRGCAVNGLGVCEAGMGIAMADLFGEGRFDLFVTHLAGEANRLFHNRTNGFYVDLVTPKGPGVTSWPYTGFGVGFFDFDNDTLFDCYVSNGRVKRGLTDFDLSNPYAEPNNLFRGLGKGEFEEVLPQGGTDPLLVAAGRGAAFGDLDNDGGIDIVVANRDGPTHVLRNLLGRRHHWIKFRVLNRAGTDALGALATLEVGDQGFWQQVQPNQSYCSSNDPRLHYGLGTATSADRIRVRWPGGEQEEFGPFPADTIQVLKQGQGSKP